MKSNYRTCAAVKVGAYALALILSLQAFVLGAPLVARADESNISLEAPATAEPPADSAPIDSDPTPSTSPTDSQPEPEDTTTQGAPEEPSPAPAPAETQGTNDSTAADPIWDVTVTAVRNTTTATIALDPSIVDSAAFDTVTLTATMTYNGTVMRSATSEFTPSDFAEGATPTMDFGNYGKFSLVASFKLNGEVVQTSDPITVGIVADTYNISPVSASLPVTFFSLNLWGENNIRETGPVILMMERPAAYDWNALPEGVYGVPYISMDDLTYQPDVSLAGYNFIAKQPALAAYVHDLYEVSPDSTFNLYVVDVYICLVQHVLYANKIPSSQYYIYMLSDGTASASRFNSFYNRADAQAHHDELTVEWQGYKDYAYETGEVSSEVPDVGSSRWYCALLSCEENIEFWVARKDVFTSPEDGDVFGSAFRADPRVIQVNIGTLLSNNIKSDPAAEAEFKRLYNFNDSFFAEAEAQNKDAMVFLGTRVNLEKDFEDYARFTQSYYGDDYVYYYKGHPATPTDLYPEKQEQLARLGVTDVESSIAAELILFFNPEIYLSGYSSSTYDSVPVGMGKGMFNMTRNAGLSNAAYRNMDYWMTRVSDSSDERFKELVVTGDDSYVVEFSDKVAIAKGVVEEGEHGATADPAAMDKANTEMIAIWDATASLITYYQLNEDKSAYVYIGNENGLVGEAAIPEGEYVIMSELADGMVLDVANGSTAAGANVRLWTSNDSQAQRWKVTYDANGLATITNAKTGKVLDVANGKVQKNGNVWQWNNNGSLAQKWRLVRNNKGAIKVLSAKDPTISLDLASGQSTKGTNLQLWTDNGTKAQQFRFVSTTVSLSTAEQASIEDGCYHIVSTLDLQASYMLQLADWGRASGTNIRVQKATDQMDEVFRITRGDDGYYRIGSVWVDLALDVAGPSLVPGANVRLATPQASSDAQKWAIYARTGGTYAIQNVATGLLLEVAGGKVAANTNVQGGLTSGDRAQTWLLKPAEDPAETLKQLVEENAGLVTMGVSVIKSASAPSLVFDVKNGSTESGAAVQLWTNNGSVAQRWLVLKDSDGLMIVFSAKSGMVLDVAGGKAIAGTAVRQYRYNGTNAQKWVAVKGESGVKLVSAGNPSVCLAVADSPGKGALLTLADVTAPNAQEFQFE